MLVVVEVGQHLLLDPLRVLVAESDPDPAPDDGSGARGGEEKPAAKKAQPNQEKPLANIMVNVLIPVVALSFLSKNPGEAGAKLWHIGPLWGMVVAVAFPLFYGLFDLIKKRKVNFFSVLGIGSVLLTGGITIKVWEGEDGVAANAATLFAIKEALIPVVFGITILASHWLMSRLPMALK